METTKKKARQQGFSSRNKIRIGNELGESQVNSRVAAEEGVITLDLRYQVICCGQYHRA